MRRWAESAADLFLGAQCAGCAKPALTLCCQCRDELVARPFVTWPQPVPPGLLAPTQIVPVAAARYDGAIRPVLAQFKEHGQFGLLPVLSRMLAASVEFVGLRGPLLLVPVPSAATARRRRGYDAIDQLARLSATLLRRQGVDCRSAPMLRHCRRVADQSGLSADDRWGNLHGAFVASGRWPRTGRSVVVVDDIVTTGATVAESVRALTAVGHRPVSIATIAATARRRDRCRAAEQFPSTLEKSQQAGYGRR